MASSSSTAIPSHAVECYKAVAVVQGRMLSIFDGVTEYRLNAVCQSSQGGLWVCPSLLALLLHAAQLPRHSALLDAPRVVLKLRCWNANGSQPKPSQGNAYKLRCTHVVPVAVLPYGAEPLPPLAEQPAAPAAPLPASRPATAPAGGGAASLAASLPPGLALRTFGGYAHWRGSALLQANTTQLEEEVGAAPLCSPRPPPRGPSLGLERCARFALPPVARTVLPARPLGGQVRAMEATLQAAQRLSTAGRVEAMARPQPAWMQRALASMS